MLMQQVLDNDAHWLTGWVKEEIVISKQVKTMNRAEGQYHLSHVYVDLLETPTTIIKTITRYVNNNARASKKYAAKFQLMFV